MKKTFLLVFLILVAFAGLRAQEEGLLVKHGDKGLYLNHTVTSGQGLYAVGRLYNVSPKYIAAYNRIDMNQGLEIGQVIRVPLTDTNFTQKNKKGIPVYYEVGPSEGLLRVSSLNNKVTMQKLRDWNGLTSDALQLGQKLIVGYLVSKEMKSPPVAVEPGRGTEVAPAKTAPVLTKAEEKQEKVPEPQPVVAAPPAEPKPETKTREEAKVEPVVRQEMPPANPAGQGYFRGSYEQQIRKNPVSKNSIAVTAGIFKTSSGWEDGKYYLLIDGVTTGTIVQLTNPDNNKSIYAKVLGEMNGIRQNQGLGIRISNAGASVLGVADTEKFILKITY